MPCIALAILLTVVQGTARADTHCYEFRNDSTAIATLSFSYQPAIGNVIVGVALDPGKTYPFDGRPWCWNLPEEVSATVAVSGAAVPHWKGTLVLGNHVGTAPSGTYVVGTAPAGSVPAASGAAAGAGAAGAGAAAAGVAGAGAVGAGAAATSAPGAKAGTASSGAPHAAAVASGTCLANSYPNSDAYCLTGLETGIQLRCGVGHTGVSGTIVVDHLRLQCRNGRKLALTCGTTTGGRQKCDLNDNVICTDDNVRSAADFCAH
ncbi:MAG TPA: hypothetical protein VMT66_12890 [Steroidobacteraceae bacterium]|nr:hypothetical protein [Steroidobacteraceae bacterium]